MQKRILEGVEVQRSSGNVFADLGLPDAEKLKIKTGLVVEIRKAIRALGINQQAAAKRMGPSTGHAASACAATSQAKCPRLHVSASPCQR